MSKLDTDEIIDIRDALLRLDETSRTVLHNNALRDCDIALRVVRCQEETAIEAADRLARYLPELGMWRSPLGGIKAGW